MMGVPTYYSRLLSLEEFDKNLCKGVRPFISGSAPLTDSVFKSFKECTGHTILERYGMSETGMITSNPLEGDRVEGTVGFPLPDVSVRICDEKGNILDQGEKGMKLQNYMYRVEFQNRLAPHIHGCAWMKKGEIEPFYIQGKIILLFYAYI